MTADVMDRNSGGELVRIDHTNTYEGTATVGGKVVKRKFRCTTKEEAVTRWRAWQDGKSPKAMPEREEERMSAAARTDKAPAKPGRVSIIKFVSGRTVKVMAAFTDADKALAMASMLDAGLEVSGADGKYDVDEVEVWG